MLGIDIGVDAIRLIELDKKRGHYRVRSHGYQQLNAGDANSVDEALRQVVRDAAPRARQAAIALPHSAILQKQIHVDSVCTEEDIEQYLKQTLFSAPNAAAPSGYFDFHIVGDGAFDPEKMGVHCVVAQKDIMESRMLAAHMRTRI